MHRARPAPSTETREPLEPDEEPKAVRPARGGLTRPLPRADDAVPRLAERYEEWARGAC